jgi:hypothetical protein
MARPLGSRLDDPQPWVTKMRHGHRKDTPAFQPVTAQYPGYRREHGFGPRPCALNRAMPSIPVGGAVGCYHRRGAARRRGSAGCCTTCLIL